MYEEVAGHDLVIVPDAALASAINRRLDRPHFGTFATTPRRFAAGRRETAEDRTAFLALIDETDHDWREIAHTIGNVLQCWEQQGDVEAILEYETYVDDVTRAVVEELSTLPTTSHWLNSERIDLNADAAVVGYEDLTPLERRPIHDEVDRIGLFSGNDWTLPPVHIYDAKTEIVTALLDCISEENAEHVALVLDAGSAYSPLVESALEAADIPYYGGPGFIDDPDHRAFLALLRAGFRGRETTIGAILPVLEHMGFEVPITHHDKRLGSVEDPGVTWFADFADTVDRRTFGDALTQFDSRLATDHATFAAELERLGIDDAPITRDRIEDLAYYLQTYDVPVERENEGVLLVDATSSAYVDRPVVFFLGVDEGWTRRAPQRPWVDADDQFDRHIRAFQRLLQSGERQYVLVQDTAGGEPVTPCLYFEDIFDESIDRFSDLEGHSHVFRPRFETTGFERTPLDVAPVTVDTLSQSSLNTYVNSPRDYFFSRLLDGPDRDYFVEGNLFHDFAEFYVAHPAFVGSLDRDEVIELMLAEAGPFIGRDDRILRERTYRIGLEMIVSYLDQHMPDDDGFLTPTSGWGTNLFAEKYDKPIDSPLTERWFENAAIGVKGKIDLVQAPNELLDYKSSSKSSTRDIVKGAAIDPPHDPPNFQAILYLSHLRTEQPDTRLSITFFHFLDPLDDAILGEPDLESALTTVTYYPFSFDAYAGSREAFEVLLEGYNDCVATFEDLGFEAYARIMSELRFPETTDKGRLRESSFAEDFIAAVDRSTSDDLNTEKGCDQAIRLLNTQREQAFFIEDLDAFEAFLDERCEELNRRRSGNERFPINGLGGDPNYRRVDHRDLFLRGETDE